MRVSDGASKDLDVRVPHPLPLLDLIRAALDPGSDS